MEENASRRKTVRFGFGIGGGCAVVSGRKSRSSVGGGRSFDSRAGNSRSARCFGQSEQTRFDARRFQNPQTRFFRTDAVDAKLRGRRRIHRRIEKAAQRFAGRGVRP